MAATDQTFRSQRGLDIVFGVSCLLMLASVVWMFYDDQYRDWKKEQRQFRDVEEAMAQRAVVRQAPSQEDIQKIADAQTEVVAARKEVEKARRSVAGEVQRLVPIKLTKEQEYLNLKAEWDSKSSIYNIAIDNRNRATDPAIRVDLDARVAELKKEVDTLVADLAKAQDAVDQSKADLTAALAPVTKAEQELSDKEDALKKLTADFDRFQRLAEQKRWGAGDWFRNLPVIDAFAPPLKIQQFTLDELTIDYSFKRVTRYDRCTTCHLGIDRPAFDKQSLTELGQKPSDELRAKLVDARNSVKARIKAGGSSSLDPSDVQLTRVKLTPSQVKEFAAHPRLDLFVDGNSPHPAEKFGCTICHAGQGSSTSFLKAVHTPNNAVQMKQWAKELDWEHDHNWDFPMLPSRFIESSCVKCHHQITDLIREGSKEEAAKLLKGYNLVRENGCFGCHEIAGIKGGRTVGPDLRVEPSPPLDAYTPAERAKLLSDPLNPPGAMRKVGPSLRRISEKTTPEWLVKWLREPRNFRPDTKMPHFYGLSNNNPDALPRDQQGFPDAEIQSIAHYLMTESQSYLKGTDKYRQKLEKDIADLEQIDPKLRSAKQNQEIEELKRKQQLAGKPQPLWRASKETSKDGKPLFIELLDAAGKVTAKINAAGQVTDPPAPKESKDDKRDALTRGRQLFTMKGCLACHQHEATTQAGNRTPALASEAHFGPNLTRLAAKLGNGQEGSARAWLVQWVLDPTRYHPRTFMPVTHLTVHEANDVATWLLAQKTDWVGPSVPMPDTKTLKDLASVHLSRLFSPSQVKAYRESGFSPAEIKDMRFDQDERELAAPLDDNKLKRYIGKKAVGQLGCFGCHDVPGFETAKPIGTPLNDWGKKDPERLAFEDAAAYVRKNHAIVPLRNDPEKPDQASKEWKLGLKDGKRLTPYEKYFYDALEHHQREGFLHQKLTEPRSYDYDRIKVWDDRLRMPQFRFSRKVAGPESTDEDRAAIEREEAEAREAVMTFILGLVAEPVPAKYVANPTGERLAEVQGRKVLDKFNCAGCHLVRPGVYDIKLTPENVKQLEQIHQINADSQKYKDDFFFADHNAWNGAAPTRPDRLTVFAVNPKLEEAEGNAPPPLSLWLARAVKFPVEKGGKQELLNLRASTLIQMPQSAFLSKTDPFGGRFANELAHFLVKLDSSPTAYPPDNKEADPLESKNARAASPPALLREGEKTQPLWLFQFLRNPHKIRPLTVLRMPKFNMSDDEALALVNYFAAADRITNPAAGLHYPYFAVPERDAGYIKKENADYVARLTAAKQLDDRLREMQPLLELQLRDAQAQVELVQGRLKAAQNAAREAKDAEDKETDAGKKKALTAKRTAAEEEVKRISAELTSLMSEGLPQVLTSDRQQVQKAEQDIKAAEKAVADADKEVKELEKMLKETIEAEKKEEDEAKKKELGEKIKDLEGKVKAGTEKRTKAEQDVKAREEALKKVHVQTEAKAMKELQGQWKQSEAYLSDTYRLSLAVCYKCHELGPNKLEKPQGPPLDQAWQRLRPDWVKRWIAHPERFMTYTSIMPQNFPNVPDPVKNKDKLQYQNDLLGTPMQQVEAERDFLMNYPEAISLPALRNRRAPVPSTGETK